MKPFPWTSLLTWYEGSGRHDLEWRDYSMDDDLRAYRVWLAEIFLQQTQVERVRGYFVRILLAYPSVHDLARASYDEFFPYYQGMGYYSRARNLLATARIISSEYAGVFPREKSLLQKLPGVGSYTSSAILAFAFGESYLAWDTNLEKVFARYYHGSRLDTLSEEEKNIIEADFQNFVRASGYQSAHLERGLGGGNDLKIENREQSSENSVATTEVFGTFDSKSTEIGLWKKKLTRAINNALMDFAATVDLKNPENIDWENYPILSGVWYETRGSLEPRDTKKSLSFPTPDASVIVILHQDHRIYYSESTPGYSPFVLPPGLTRDTRRYVQESFRERYGLELSVRPAQKKWISPEGKPYILVNAQIQTGDISPLRAYTKEEAKSVIDAL